MDQGICLIDPEREADALLGLWNRNIGTAFPLDSRLLLQQLRLDTDPKCCFAVRSTRGALAGAVLVKRSARTAPGGGIPPVGNISFILVDRESRRKGIGSRLLGAAFAWLEERGAEECRLGRDRYHLFPGLPLEAGEDFAALEAFLTRFGFEPGADEYDLRADLSAVSSGEAGWSEALPAEYSFGFYRPEFREPLAVFLAKNFPGRWHADTLEALDASMRHEDLVLLTERTRGTVVGFSRIYDEGSTVIGPGLYWRALMGEHPGALGPIGIDGDERGRGLGLALLGFCIEELRRRGVRTMVIDWTDLVNFYGKMGFTIWKSYRLMSVHLTRAHR